jgi:chitinase
MKFIDKTAIYALAFSLFSYLPSAYANQLPTANAGTDSSVNESALVALQGKGQDADGTIVAYQWRQTAGPAVTLANANKAQASFTAPMVGVQSKLSFQLTVTDNQGASASDAVNIYIKPTVATQWVMGYYVAYQQSLYPANKIDWNGLTHIIMGRVKAKADGTLDTNFDWDATNGPLLAKDIAARAHTAGKKAILMLGGDDNGVEIHDAVANHRAEFIANLLAIMNDYGYDGLDLDWENTIDWDLFVTFVTELRQAAPNAILTVPTGPINLNTDTVDPHYPLIAQQIDRLTLMSYYPATSWAGSGWFSWYNSPLKGAKPTTPVSIEDSFNRFAAAGVPKSKLAMGISFYATCYTGGITGPNQSTENGVTIEGGDNNFMLSDLFGTGGSYAQRYRHWDTVAAQPYLSLPKAEQHQCKYVTFEDEQSILVKGKFSRDNGYGGIIIWTINQGYVKTHSQPNFLLEALANGFLTPGKKQTVGISITQGDTWLKTDAKIQFNALVTGSLNKAVTWSITEPNCGSIDSNGNYIAPSSEQTCTVNATSQADPTKQATIKTNIANTPWTPSFSVVRLGTWWVEVTAIDPSVASMSIRWPDGSTLPLRYTWTNGNNQPIFAANYQFPDNGGLYTFYAKSANNRSATVKLTVPACVHGADGVCK